METNNLASAIQEALYDEVYVSGDKGGSQQPRKAVESPDSLISIAQARIVDLVSEGEIEGFPSGVNFLRDIYLDETPIENSDGSRNFKSLQVDARTGTQDQTYIPGFPAVENELAVGVELKFSASWTRSFTNKSLSAVRVRLGLSALSRTDQTNGDIKGHLVNYAIDVATDGGPFVEVMRSAFNGKASSLYERSHRIDLPESTISGWTVRVRRTTADNTSSYIQDTTTVQSVTEIIDGKFRYPMSAVVGLQIDASQFQSIPTRAYRLKGRRIKVPTNYNPETRAYTGVWDGTFKVAYSNNPAWVFYDLSTHARYGLGHLVSELRIDKYSLYAIGQYCDEIVPDGFGGTEPRMTCNLYLQRGADAWKVLGDMASVFRGICYWAGGTIVPVADRPVDPVYTYTNANVVDGVFKYESSGRKARHTAVIVGYNDMTDFGRLKYDYYDDPEMIARFGFQLVEIIAMGCTSRGQAQRTAKWLLFSERYLTNTCTWQVGLDGTWALPGQIVRVADKWRAGRRTGGRISAATLNSVTLDALPTPAPALGDTITVILPTGLSETRTIGARAGNVITPSVNFSAIPAPQSVWAVESNDLKNQLYRILAVNEGEGGVYSITGLQHNQSLFDAVDLGEPITVPPISLVASPSQARPTVVTVTSVERAGEVIALPLLTAAWPRTPGAVRYQIQWRKDQGEWSPTQDVHGTTADYQTPFPGVYEAKVQAINALGVVSAPQYSAEYTLVDQSLKPGFVDQLNADIAAALLEAENAAAIADGAIEFFWQISPPVIGAGVGEAKEGDFWVDIDAGNHMWRATSGIWVDAQDDEIGQALIAATTAQATADGKVKTWFGAVAPAAPDVTGTKGIGDLWFNTTTKKLHRWNGADWNLEISDVTLDQIGGSGVNIMPERYTRFINSDMPGFHSSTSALALVADVETLGGYYLRNTTQTVDPSQNWSYFANPSSDKNIFMEPGDYLLSYYAKSNVAGHQIRVTVAHDIGGTGSSVDQALTTTRARYVHKITVPAGSTKGNVLVYWNRSGVAGRQISIDGLMVEPMVGRLIQASKWAPGSTAAIAYDAIAAAALAQDTADGKIQLFQQPTIPSNGSPDFATLGDLWVDTDDDSFWRHNGTTFVESQDDAIAQAIAAAAGAQGTADGKVTTFYKSSAPTNADAPPAIGSLKVGDLWYNTTNAELSRYSGSSWVKIADITSEHVGGNGTNILWAEYAQQQGPAGAKDENSNPGFNVSGATVDVVTDAFSPTGFSLRFTTASTLASSYVRFNNINVSNLVIGGNRKYLLSFYYKSNVNGHQIKPFVRGDLAQDYSPINAGPADGSYQRHTVVVNAEGIADGKINVGFFVNPSGAAVGRLLYVDRIMLEPMIGNKEEASPWTPGPSALQTAIAIANAAFAQATADGKVEMFRQASTPTASGEGDIWIDTDDGKMYTWSGTAWIYDPNDELGNAINTAQSTANARNTTFYSTTTPTALAIGDLWYNSSTMDLRRWDGASWTLTSGSPQGGNGENLLPNPTFVNTSVGGISGSAAAAGQPLCDGWQVRQQATGYTSADVSWHSSGAIRLRDFGTTAHANGTVVISAAQTMKPIPMEEGRTYKFEMTQDGGSFNGSIPANVNIRTRMTIRTLDASGTQISYAEVVQGNRIDGTFTGTYTVPVGSGTKSAIIILEALIQNLSGASWTHNSSVALNQFVKRVSMVKVANLDTEVQDGSDYGRYGIEDGYTYLGKRRFGLRIPGSGHRIGDQRNLPQSIVNAFGSVRTTSSLSATSAGAVSILAHTIRMGGSSISYNAVSNAVTGLTQNVTYTIYCLDDGYAGGTRTWFASSSTVDNVMNLGDGIVIAGTIKIPTSGSSGGGGGGYLPGDCVDYDSVLPDGRLVRELVPGVDQVLCIDVTNPNAEPEWHTVRAIKFGTEECYRLTSMGLVSVVQSESTPMNLPDGQVLRTPDMFGKPILVNVDGKLTWDIVADLERVGPRPVIKIDLGNRMFFAGETERGTIATHNIIHKPD